MSYDCFSAYYDLLTDNVEYEKRAEYFCKLIATAGQEKGILLDLACGTGSLSVEFAKRGFEVIGVDISPQMLTVAREKAYEQGADVLLLCQPMQELDLYGTVDAAVCALDSINHLESAEDVKETFRKVSLFMNPGGVFVFDVNTIYKHACVLGDNAFVFDCEDLFCTWQNSFDPADNSVQVDLDFFEDDGSGAYIRTSESFVETAFELDEISEWLCQAGFEVLGVYDDLSTLPVNETSERAVFLARKK